MTSGRKVADDIRMFQIDLNKHNRDIRDIKQWIDEMNVSIADMQHEIVKIKNSWRSRDGH